MDLARIQEALRREQLDGWLFFDHHGRDPLAYRVLGFPFGHVSRRWYYFIPAEGEPRGVVHRVESKVLDSLPGEKLKYSRWQEQHACIQELVKGAGKIAMQYSPLCAVPYVALVDAGTVELVRSFGVTVTSSAELVQEFEAVLTDKQFATHLEAGKIIDRVRGSAFKFIGDKLDAGIDELTVRDWILEQFTNANLVTDHGPIVGVNGHAGDPHYEPKQETNAPIRRGDFVLLDMWAKFNKPGSVFYDITWTGFCGDAPDRIRNVFEIVRDARDQAVNRVASAFQAGQEIRGFEVDDAARTYIESHGFGKNFVHRTGHSIGEDVHGNGANMDNFETHDDRRILPGSLFSVEPGVYLRDFGVRAEVNVFARKGSASTTGEVQRELVRIG